MSDTSQPEATEPRFPMPEAAIRKAQQEGRSIAQMPAVDFEKPRRPPSLAPGRIKPAEAAYKTHFVTVEPGTRREAFLHPTFWAHVANRLRPLDRIEVTDDEHSFLAVLIVRSVDRVQAVVAELSNVVLKSGVDPKEVAAGYTVKWRTAKYKHSVIDSAGNVVQDGFGTKEEAEAWIASKARAMAA